MKKTITIFILLGALFLIFSCDAPPLSNEDANRMMQETLIATQTEMGAAMSTIGGTKGVTRDVYTGEYTNGDGSFYLSVTVNNDDPENVTWDGEMTFTDFTTYNGSVINGDVSIALELSDAYNFSFSYDGDLAIEFEDATYDVTWDITYAMSVVDTTMTVSYTGVFIVNGYEYTYNYSTEQELITR